MQAWHMQIPPSLCSPHASESLQDVTSSHFRLHPGDAWSLREANGPFHWFSPTSLQPEALLRRQGCPWNGPRTDAMSWGPSVVSKIQKWMWCWNPAPICDSSFCGYFIYGVLEQIPLQIQVPTVLSTWSKQVWPRIWIWIQWVTFLLYKSQFQLSTSFHLWCPYF